jgi:subtilase family serine protease
MKSILYAGGVAVCLFASLAQAQSAPQITAALDESKTVSLPGNVRPEVSAQNDRGRVSDDFAMEGMQLLLKRPAAQEAALEKSIDDMQNPTSPRYHQWLTAQQIGERFGVANGDVSTVTSWLASHGFHIDGVSSARTIINFSGTAGQVNTTFHTEIHNLSVNGAHHIANVSEPRIPAALATVVEGVVSLNDFRPFPMHELKQPFAANKKGASRFHTKKGQDLAPSDLAVIYNFGPLFRAGITGQGETIVLIENTYVYDTNDWKDWRKSTGISKNGSATITEVSPSGRAACSKPGVNGDDVEAILDTQWASAAAPGANIELAACKNTSTTFGGLLALDNVIDGSKPPQIISVSYGACEATNGAALNAAFNSIYQQGAAEGISIFVASGDQATTVCDRGAKQATHGVGVNGWGSTVYNVSVGGTDFADTFIGDTSHYWNDKDGKFYESAKSYVPEIPWDDSCASRLIAVFVTENNNELTYGRNGFCNSSSGSNFQNVIGGSGGPSACATGKPATASVVGGTCKGYKKPPWQKLVGVPNDGVRDLPDVALFAADGIWAHSYVYCDSDPSDTGAANNGGCGYAGGTSFASPIYAGIQALINQTKKNKAQGNPDPVFYQLAQKAYGSSGNANCNSTGSTIPAASCIFNDITAGENNPPCEGKNDCYRDVATIGVISTSSTVFRPAYVSQTGWDFTTGIGTVNVTNLVHAWP